MATLLEHAEKLANKYPDGGPVYLAKMAEVFWPEADWLNHRVNGHNGGALRGARCAGALAGRLERAGYLRKTMGSPRNYRVKVEAIREALKQATTDSGTN